MKKTKVILSVLFILLFSRFVMADIINVPADQPTIQQGLNVATEGDTVLVAPSTYYENLFWPATNGITLLSETGAENTIIDGSNSSAVIYTFGTTIDTTTVINGFTLQNGTADSGGGISCLDASPLVKNCIIENNEGGGCAFTNSFAVLKNNEIRENNGNGIKCEECSNITTEYCNIENNNGSGIYLFSTSSGDIIECDITGNSTDHGGGIYCNESSPSLENVIITNNSALDGGGIYCLDSSPSLMDVTISDNTSTGWEPFYGGGGIYCSNSNPSLENVIITNNSALDGGGIYCSGSSPSLVNVTITNNSDALRGGGIYCKDSSPSLVNVTIRDNSVSHHGGGIYCEDSNPSLENVTITNNSSDYCGGGISCWHHSSPSLENVTITNNSTGYGEGGGISCWLYSSPSLVNVTITDNSANSGGGIYCYHNSSPSLENVTITNNSAGEYGGGIRCYDSSPSLVNVSITDNSAVNGGGIYCSGSSPSLSKVTITLNSANLGGAIYCTNSNSTIENCTITENSASEEGDGIYTENSSEPTIHNSNILLNGYGIFNNDPSVMLAADNNYWGDETGPYHEFWNPSGLGDSVNQFVNPIPFLTEADITAPPIPPFGLDTLAVGLDYFTIIWQNSPIGDLAGYKVYFDSDSTGFPYSDTVDVGIDTTYTITNLITGTTYYIAVTCYDNSGEESWYSNEIEVTPGGVNIDDNTLHLPKSFYLSQNYPNPFNPETTISFSIPKYSKVEISIYNIKGQKVKTIAKKDFEKGIHKVIWNGKDIAGKSVSSGIYFYKMETGNFSEIKKAILLK